MRGSLRKSGHDIIGEVPWGTHFCHFYQTKEDLMDILIPYFKTGLENNEFCLWAMSQPLNIEDAKEALRIAIPDLDIYLHRGQIEIIPYSGGFTTAEVFDSEKAFSDWIKKINHALDSGYDGLRFGGDISWMDKEGWNRLVEYEKQIDNIIHKYQRIVLCTYSLNKCSATEIIDIVSNHQFALVKKEGEWERIENFGQQQIIECMREDAAMSQSEQPVRLKLETILSPALETAFLEFSEIVDIQAIQSLMDDFYELTHIPMGLNDIKGNVLASTGWQDICTKFHRVHPEACKHCIESNIKLSVGVAPGEFKLFKCKNNMWDIATPIMLGGQQVGIIFSGQFFFEDEPLDYEFFRSQARKYCFDEEEYIAVLEKVPRLSRETVDRGMTFLTKLANIISQLSYSNVKLAQSLLERDSLVEALRESEERYRNIVETANEGIWIIDNEDRTIYANNKMAEMLGYSQEEMIGKSGRDFTDERDKAIFEQDREKRRQDTDERHEFKLIHKDGSSLWMLVNTKSSFDKNGKLTGSMGMLTDITRRKQEEQRTRRYNRILEGINRIFGNVVQAETEEELGNACLSVALELTGSKFGFINEIGADGLLHDVAKSEMGWEQCFMEDKTGHRRPPSNFIVHGLYGSVITNQKSLLTNDPQSHPDSLGVPPGHPSIKSFLGVPLVQNEETVGLIAVANRENGYSHEQQEDLEAIAPAVVQVLQRKKIEQGRERSEKALQVSEERYRSLYENSLDGILLTRPDGTILSANPQTLLMFGMTEDEIKRAGREDILVNDEKLAAALEERRRTGRMRAELTHRRKDGSTFICDTTSKTFVDADGNISTSLIIRDITERKRAEEALRQSEERYRQLFESLRDAFAQVSMDGRIIEFNDIYCKMLGYSPEEMRTLTYQELTPERWHAFEDYIVREQIIPRGYSDVYEKEYRRRDGIIVPVELRTILSRDESGRPKSMWAIVRDTTERKKAEKDLEEAHKKLEEAYELLLENERRLNEAQRMAHIGSLDWNFVTNEIHWSDEFYHIFGRSPQELTTHNEFLDCVHPDDRDYVDNTFKKAFDGDSYSIDYRIILPDGEERIIHAKGKVIFDERSIPVRLRGTNQDITEQKKVEIELKQANNYNRSLIEASLDPLVTIGPNGKITDVNNSTKNITGYSRDELIGTDFSDYFTEPEKARKGYQQVFKEGSVFDYELEIQNKNGSITPVLYNSSVYKDECGKVIGVFAAARDIKERKQAEKALKKAYDNLEEKVKERTAELEEAYKSLKESEKGLAEAQEMAHIGNWEWDIAKDKAYWSEEMFRIFRRDPQKLAPSLKEYLSYIHPDDLDYYCKATDNTRKISTSGFDFRIILADGEERTLHLKSYFIYNDENIPVRTKGIVQDITERKKTEEKIQTLVNVVESSDDAIAAMSLEGTITSWNKGAEHIYGYSAEEIIGKDISVVEPDNLKGEIKSFSEKIKQGEKSQSYDTLRLKKDGTLINVSATLSPVFNSSGKLVAISAIARDITERTKAEKALAEMDKIRIKEIHHRIKNNLQVISSLLDLQAEKFGDKEVLEAFKESQNRVLSMSLIHEELYKGEGTETLDFSAYLLKLAENLFKTYSFSSKNIRLYMDLEEKAFFDMDTAVPLGIIVNELVSNSLKHAFTKNQEGEIRIRLFREGKNNEIRKSLFSLTISDSGKGIPKNVELESLESLGLQLVYILVDQLDGELELKREQGTEFRITFNVAEKDHEPG